MFLLLSVCYTLALPLGFWQTNHATCGYILQEFWTLIPICTCVLFENSERSQCCISFWLTAWIDIARSIGFIDLKNNSSRVLMRLIMCSFLTQVWWHAYLSLSAKGKILWLMVIRLCFYPLKRGKIAIGEFLGYLPEMSDEKETSHSALLWL